MCTNQVNLVRFFAVACKCAAYRVLLIAVGLRITCTVCLLYLWADGQARWLFSSRYLFCCLLIVAWNVFFFHFVVSLFCFVVVLF